MPAIILTDEEISALQTLVSAQKDGFATTKVALARPFVDLSDFSSDIRELVSRARDGSSHISEDFEDFLKALKEVDKQSDKLVKARKQALKT